MKRRYGLMIIILLLLLAGVGARVIVQHFTFDYLYRTLIKREFATNPLVEIQADKKYRVRLWYYPFYRTVLEEKRVGGEEKERFFAEIAAELKKRYPNILLSIGELDFLNGRDRLKEALAAGEPPDLYLNFSNDFLLDSDWQIPVEPYLSGEEKNGFYTLDWEIINRDHLWGWPLLVQQQSWLSNIHLPEKDRVDFMRLITGLERETLALNYADMTLLRQFLTLRGLESFTLKDGRPEPATRQALEEVFSQLHQLREKQLFALSTINMDERFLGAFLNKKAGLIGPLNPWLENFLLKQGRDRFDKVNLDKLIRVYSLAVFRQRKYQGDDHTRAVMETARLIAEKYSEKLAEGLGLLPAYRSVAASSTEPLPKPVNLLEITPAVRDYWEGVLKPLWLDFWQKGLTPEEVMARLNS